MKTLTNLQRIALHRLWWNQENSQRLALIYTPLTYPYGGLDIEVQSSEIAHRKRADAAVQYQEPKDTLVTGRVNYATALIPGMLGAGFMYDGYTSWAIPNAQSILDVNIAQFDPHHALFQNYIEKLQALLEDWNWATYLPVTNAYLGPMDVLAGLLGPQQLSLDLYEHPDHVKGKALDAAHYLVEMVQYELGYFRSAGIQDGTPCGFNYWLPGSGFLFSEDFCALVSRRHYETFFLQADIEFCKSVDSAFLHLHSAGLQCLPSILENPYLRGMEIAHDVGNLDIRPVIQGARSVQWHGLPVQISSWEHPLQDWETELILNELDTPGLLVALQANSYEQAVEYYSKIKNWPVRGTESETAG